MLGVTAPRIPNRDREGAFRLSWLLPGGLFGRFLVGAFGGALPYLQDWLA